MAKLVDHAGRKAELFAAHDQDRIEIQRGIVRALQCEQHLRADADQRRRRAGSAHRRLARAVDELARSRIVGDPHRAFDGGVAGVPGDRGGPRLADRPDRRVQRIWTRGYVGCHGYFSRSSEKRALMRSFIVPSARHASLGWGSGYLCQGCGVHGLVILQHRKHHASPMYSADSAPGGALPSDCHFGAPARAESADHGRNCTSPSRPRATRPISSRGVANALSDPAMPSPMRCQSRSALPDKDRCTTAPSAVNAKSSTPPPAVAATTGDTTSPPSDVHFACPCAG